MLLCWTGSNDEEYVGNPEFFEDQQEQPENTEQGKYSLGSTLMPYSPLITYSFCMPNFDNCKNILVVMTWFLDSYGSNAYG
jgi:hypothetical protein